MCHDESNVIYYPSSGDGGTPRVANTRHCTRLVGRNESLPAALRIYGGAVRRLEIGTVTHRWFYLYDRVRTFSLVPSKPTSPLQLHR